MPVTVVKVRAESSGARPLAASVAALWRARGARGFFAGSAATALRDAPYAGLYVVAYEAARRRLARAAGVALPEEAAGGAASVGPRGAAGAAAVNFSAGALAAAAATAATNPFDVVKTRVQLSDASSSPSSSSRGARKANGMAAVALRVVRDEGWRRLFDGLALRVTRKALSSALAWTVYEELVRRAEARWIAAAAV
jgi:solute carrier family 25 protein 38